VRQGKRPASRGVARRNAKLKVLRDLVSRDRAIVVVDLASQRQVAVVCDHDSVVLARRVFRGSAWCISEILAWAGPVAENAGFTGVVLACEPTGHRWKPLQFGPPDFSPTIRAGCGNRIARDTWMIVEGPANNPGPVPAPEPPRPRAPVVRRVSPALLHVTRTAGAVRARTVTAEMRRAS
jgi:hypothetical protein